MKSHPQNPSENQIPAGIAESELLAAIGASGYPLQGIAAARLLPDFNVIEEWGYVDDATKEHRSLDIYAFRPLTERSSSNLHIGLNLLIECKRSRHPFVFFKQVLTRGAPRFPHIHGIPHSSVSIHHGNKLIGAWPAFALGLDRLPFVNEGPPVCASFSKAIPNGKKVELSGTDPFNTIVLPLVKALRHTAAQRIAPGINDPIYPTLTLCVSILDAPMLVVEAPDSVNSPVLHPWVRVVRHESTSEPGGFSKSRFYAIDLVHVHYLSTFLNEHLLPFASEFATRVAKMEGVLRYGGNVSDLENWTWEMVQPRPKPSR